ncbi:ATP-binding protein [Thalassotalea mangrovi]|uniref:histidine kinase n=1 Tax=Thalassotalea mangrovi TaxID=2572245 RepID=A0A4U1BAH5_9GAMM|nr:ATP-binding protein [Thalassotalea mangrovi]TKB47833.1 response regulator [Thalassotalea mangrovi]
MGAFFHKFTMMLSCITIFYGGLGSVVSAESSVTPLIIKAEQQHHITATSLTVQNGLSSNSVQDLEFDRFHRLWVATQDGVNLVDANNVVVFTAGQAEKTLKSGYINELAADYHDGLWVVTNKSLERINIVDMTVTDITPQLGEWTSLKNLLRWDREHMAFLLDGKIFLLHTQTLHIRQYPKRIGAVKNIIRSGDRILAYLDHGFSWIDPKTFVQTPHFAAPPESETVINFTVDSQQSLWLVTLSSRVYQCNNKGCQVISFIDDNQRSVTIGKVISNETELYALSTNGLFVIDQSRATVRLIKSDNRSDLFQKRPFHHQLLFSENNDLLVGTMGGVFYLSANYNSISSYPDLDALFEQEMLGVAKVKSGGQEVLVIAGAEQLLYFSEHNGQLQLLKRLAYPENFEPVYFISTKNGVFLNSYRSGTLQVTYNGWQKLTDSIPGLAGNPQMLMDIRDLANGHRLLLFPEELLLLKPIDDQYKLVWQEALPTDLAFNVLVHQQQLFIATFDDGLLITPFSATKPPQTWQTMAEDIMLSGLKEVDGRLMLLTIGNGLWQLQRTQGQWQHEPISGNARLLNRVAMCLAPYVDEQWLLSTQRGVSILGSQFNFQQNLTIFDGLSHRESIHFGCTQINKHTVNLGFRGVTIFHQPIASKQSPQLQWVATYQDGNSFAMDASENEFVLPRQLSFHTAISFLPVPARATIEYRLAENEGSWIAQDDTTVRLSSLSPGNYQLQVRARLFDGTLTDTLTYPFIISPPVWQQPMALFVYALLLIVLVLWIFRQIVSSKLERLALLEQQRTLQENYTKELQSEITQRTRELEQKQQDSIQEQQEKARFITGASHDLRNLVSLLKLKVTGAKPSADSVQPAETKLADIVENLDHLTDDIVQLSKLDVGVIKPVFKTCDVNQLIDASLELFVAASARKNIELEKANADIEHVLTDIHLLSRMLNNLIDNAIKNTPTGGKVSIAVTRCDGNCMISIRDTGPGLPEPVRQQWPRAFLRGTDAYTGSGLGLSIVAKIAELLNISVSYHQARGQGATFTMTVPRAVDLRRESLSLKSHHVTVAIIEDDPQQLQWLSETLAAKGYHPEPFSSAQAFFDGGRQDYQVIISDVDLGDGKDGIDYLADYQRQLVSKGSIIYISGDLKSRNRTLDLDKVYFLAKPIKLKKLERLLLRGIEK